MTWQMITYISVAAAAIPLFGYGVWKGWQIWREFLARPKKYFLRNLQETHQVSLRNAGIEFEAGSAPDATVGVLVKYEHLKNALRAIGAAHTATLILTAKQLHEAVLAFPHARAEDNDAEDVTVWYARRDKKIRPRVQKIVHSVLFGRIDKRFSVDLDGDRGSDYDRDFRICFGTVPRGSSKEALPPRVFDVEVAPQNAFVYSVTGSPVIDPATGYIVGELNKNTLYIFADFWQLGEEQGYALLTRILQ
ncbi:MAG: hypothetical protein IT342_11140, partial [Candidatus Melainabacteria bacterium]|nr:hypothetical protein [Candidatus Melainabacteria bacterium]